MKKIIDLLRKGLLQNIIIGIYFITLLGECYCLYYRYYFTRIYTRPTLVPILFLIFLQQFISITESIFFRLSMNHGTIKVNTERNNIKILRKILKINCGGCGGSISDQNFCQILKFWAQPI